MDTWLRDHLIASGHLTETGLSRRARLRACGHRGCRDLVLVGLDSDVAALEVACDPQPLSPLGEALALLDGRRTLTLRRDGRGWVLDWRDAHEIAWAPAATTPRRDVLATHACRHPIPAGWVAPSGFPEVTPPPPLDSPCPF